MKKKLLVLISSIILVLVISFAIYLSNKPKNTTIGFYDIPYEVSSYIESIIHKEDSNLKTITLSEKDVLNKKIINKVDMLISYNNAVIQQNKKYAEKIGNEILESYGRSILNSKLYLEQNRLVVQPILFDLFEAAVLKNTYNYDGIPLPEYFSQFTSFARKAKENYAIPIVISGADDINVNSFLSIIIESYGGKDAYYEIADKLSKTTNFEDIYDFEIGGDAKRQFTIRDLLKQIKEWQAEGLIDSNWYERTSENTAKFIDNSVVALSFMNISEHRTKHLPNIRYYTTMQIPAEYAEERLCIQPAIVAISFKNNSDIHKLQKLFANIEIQEKLSNETKLASAILQGETYDSLTNTARYLAVSTKNGPVPDLGTLALDSKEKQHELAEAVRNFCRK